MTDHKENKNSPLRLSPELRSALDREKGARMMRGERISYTDLLSEAWRHYSGSASPNVGIQPSSDSDQVNSEASTIYAPSSNSTITESEQAAIDLLLLVLRRGTQVQREALTMNLHAFAEPIQQSQEVESESGSISQPVDFSEALEHLINAAEAVGSDEATLGKLAADLRKLRAQLDAPKRDHRKHGGEDRKGRG